MLSDREGKTSGPPRDAGRIIRAWRRRIGLTQEGLAQALRVTFSTVSRWENGHVKPSKLAWKALAAPPALARGAARFDISDTREYVEGAIVGLDPRVLRRLRRGDFAWQDHLYLHGMTSATARVAVDRFLAESVALGHRCVLIVHGRGRNSKDQTPVLKERLKSWLARGRAARIVLGFTTARPCDGGAGALYVLLRRDRRRRPIRVTEGAKV